MGIYRPDCSITTNTPAETAILAGFNEMLSRGGSQTTIVPEIQRVKFAKNIWNVAFAGFATLVGYRLPAIFRPPPKDGESYEPYVCETTRSYVEEYTITNIRAILEEVLSVGMCASLPRPFVFHPFSARAMGFPDSSSGIPSSIVEDTLKYTTGLHTVPTSTHTPSMLLDAQRGRPIEVEVIVGSVVRLAREKGVQIPVSSSYNCPFE